MRRTGKFVQAIPVGTTVTLILKCRFGKHEQIGVSRATFNEFIRQVGNPYGIKIEVDDGKITVKGE